MYDLVSTTASHADRASDEVGSWLSAAIDWAKKKLGGSSTPGVPGAPGGITGTLVTLRNIGTTVGNIANAAAVLAQMIREGKVPANTTLDSQVTAAIAQEYANRLQAEANRQTATGIGAWLATMPTGEKIALGLGGGYLAWRALRNDGRRRNPRGRRSSSAIRTHAARRR